MNEPAVAVQKVPVEALWPGEGRRERINIAQANQKQIGEANP
jgi:hypothetical protein